MLNRILICETQRRLFYGWLPPRSVNLIIAHPLLHSSQSHVFRTLVHCFHLTHHHWPWLGDGWRLSTILYSWNIEKMRRLHESISAKLSNKTVNWQYVYVWRVSGWKLYSRDCSLVYELVSGSHVSTDCIMGLTTILTTNHWLMILTWLEWVLETDHTHAQHETHSQEHRGQTNHVTKSLVLLHAELLMMTMLDGWSDTDLEWLRQHRLRGWGAAEDCDQGSTQLYHHTDTATTITTCRM